MEKHHFKLSLIIEKGFLPYLFVKILFTLTQQVQNLQNLFIKMINYTFNVEKFVKNEALLVQSLNKYLQ